MKRHTEKAGKQKAMGRRKILCFLQQPLLTSVLHARAKTE